MNLLRLIQQRFELALTGFAADPTKYATLVRPAQDAKFGDYQANCAMPLGKELGKPPRVVAQEIVNRLELGDLLETPQIAGPGFINLRLKSEWLAKHVQTLAGDDRLGVSQTPTPRTFVIDFSSPNVAKPLHVGHLRSTIIGDALTRTLRFLGHTVIADNHLGDWGTQFGMLIYGYKQFRDDAAYQADPVRELTRIYLHVRELTKGAEEEDDKPADPVAKQYLDACRHETVKLHEGDPENVAIWKQFMPAGMKEIHAIYDRLGVKFDAEHGESFYNDMLPAVVVDVLAKGVAQESQGAVVIPRADRPDDPPAIVRKKDGAFTYTASDLATIQYRAKTWNPDAMLYVVDARQSLHFETFFAAARRWGYDRIEFTHVSFGSVLGPDRRPLKTREGGTIELDKLLDEGVEQARQAYEQTRADRRARGDEVPELSEEEKGWVAELVGIGAIKYADLSQHRSTDYVFQWSKMLAMDGNTATYMQYAYARCRSILRKGDTDVEKLRNNAPAVFVAEPAERALALQLLRFEDTLNDAAQEYLPHVLTGYLWDLAKTFSVFFNNCPVLKAQTPALRDSRLLLCDLTARVIQKTLNLLGIQTVERM